MRKLLAVATVSVASLALAACGSSSHSSSGKLSVVAGEDTWGSIAAALGAGHVDVTSIITNPNTDPHEYTANVRNAAAVAGADLVIENGAGYDDFLPQLVSSSGADPKVLVVASVAHARGPNPNPHFWYDLTTVRAVASTIEHDYEAMRPSDASQFRAALSAFDASLEPVQSVIDTIRTEERAEPVAYTERVPGYLVTAAGLTNRTPVAFAQAIEDGFQPSVAATVSMQNLLSTHAIRVLLYNDQTVTSLTSQIEQQAKAAGIAIVPVSETLPAHTSSYVTWQLDQDTALLHALQR